MSTVICCNLCGFVMDHLDCADVAVGQVEVDQKSYEKVFLFVKKACRPYDSCDAADMANFCVW